MERDENYVVAIDMGTTKVATLVGRKAEDGKVEVVAASCCPATGIARGDIKNIEQIAYALQNSLDTITKEAGIKVCEAYIGLSGQYIKCQQHDGYVFVSDSEGEVREEDVARLSDSMRNIQVPAGEAIIHILPQSYLLDSDTDTNDNPVGMIGRKLEGIFNIITGDKKNLDLIGKCIKRVDVSVTQIILNSLAAAEAVLVDDEKELGVAVIDIGGGTCDICIYHDKKIRYLGVIPIGGEAINKDIKSCGVLERQVEKLKVKFGSAISDDVPSNKIITLPHGNNTPSKEIPQKILAKIIEARMLDIIERVDEILERTGYKGRLASGIVLTGGGALLKDVDKLFRRELNCDVRVAVPSLYVTSDTLDKVNSPVYSTALGLLLKGIDIGRPTRTIVMRKSRAVPYEGTDYVRGGQPRFEPPRPSGHGGYGPRNIVSEEDYDEIKKQVTENPGEPDGPVAPRKKSWIKSVFDGIKGAIDNEELEDNNI